LVDDLLDVSRITRGKVALRKQILDLATVISKAVEMATPLLEERGHSLEVSVEDGPLHVDADPARLAQVIANLLTNAAKYTERGGQIVLKVALERDDVVTTVRDNGMGIAADLLPRVFDLFVQADRTLDRAKGGLGIGLTVVKRLVEVHGGTVVARSEGPGRGSEFVVTLPGARSELAEAAAVPARPTLTVAGRTRAPRKVLIVDDNVDLAMTLAEALAEMGHHTRVANDAVAALEAAGVFQPDIALLDIGLPVMDGYELATKLRGDLKLARVGLIAVTGYGHQADRERAHAAGFDAHLVKPVDLEKVEQVIVSMSTEQAREQQRATAPDLYPK
jgi:CheY-like chemotaxis protein/anti-sigma regulatory factor (Ser/Thr protein kinase)